MKFTVGEKFHSQATGTLLVVKEVWGQGHGVTMLLFDAEHPNGIDLNETARVWRYRISRQRLWLYAGPTHIEEREWKFGTGWFRWLSWFRKPKVSRSLDIRFSEEVGKDKGSWKGGKVGHGIDMLPGELHEAAFRRYCEKEHSAKDGKYRVTFVGVVRA